MLAGSVILNKRQRVASSNLATPTKNESDEEIFFLFIALLLYLGGVSYLPIRVEGLSTSRWL